MKSILHGYGVMEFQDVVEIDPDFFDGWLERRKANEPSDYILQEDGTYLNRGGYRFTAEQVNESPSRILRLEENASQEDIDFYQSVYNGMGECIKVYCQHFPEVEPCIWWRAHPHVATYAVTGNMGFHHDNLIGDGKESNNAIFTVLTGSLILKDRCEGGNLLFKYAGLDIAPKAGSAFIYSAGYLGTHAVEPVLSGERVSYLEFFGHGPQEGSTEFAWR